jgi:hypothetical protein
MPSDDKIPYRLRRVNRIEEIDPLLEKPYNKPIFSDESAKERYREEYEEADSLVRSKLMTLGEIDAFGHKEFSMGNPWNSSRKIGVTVNTAALFDEELIGLLKAAIDELTTDYLILLSGEYEPGEGTFYICITKAEEVLGYAENPELLEPFGFV